MFIGVIWHLWFPNTNINVLDAEYSISVKKVSAEYISNTIDVHCVDKNSTSDTIRWESPPANQFRGLHHPIGVYCSFKSSMRCGLNWLINAWFKYRQIPLQCHLWSIICNNVLFHTWEWKIYTHLVREY